MVIVVARAGGAGLVKAVIGFGRLTSRGDGTLSILGRPTGNVSNEPIAMRDGSDFEDVLLGIVDFRVTAIVDDGKERVIGIETPRQVAGCPSDVRAPMGQSGEVGLLRKDEVDAR